MEEAVSLKVCKFCKQPKERSCFGVRTWRRDGIDDTCRDCHRKIAKDRRDSMSTEETEIERQRHRGRYQKRKETAQYRAYMARTKDAQKKRLEKYHSKHENYLKSRLRTWIETAFKRQGIKKVPKDYVKYLGCSLTEFVAHTESLFQEGMNWDNNGRAQEGDSVWQFDHIKPTCSFDLSDENQRYECYNFKNVKPSWNKDHKKKSVEDRAYCVECARQKLRDLLEYSKKLEELLKDQKQEKIVEGLKNQYKISEHSYVYTYLTRAI